MNKKSINYFKKIDNKKVYAIITVYKPSYLKLENTLLKTSRVFSKVITVCNSQLQNKFVKNFKNIKFIQNKKNLGLAKAMNKGIKYAIKNKATHVVLFDQDTRIKYNFLKKIKNFSQKHNLNNVAAISPLFFNKLTKQYGYNWNSLKSSRPDYFHPEYLITSGTLIPTKIFKKVGFMREKMNIDLVDLDWCKRAKKKNLKYYCIPSILFEHNIGIRKIEIFNKIYNIHSPLRLYYYFRNSIFVYRQNYSTINWIISDIVKNIFRLFFYLFFVQPRKKYIYFIFLGIYHGLKNKMGNLK